MPNSLKGQKSRWRLSPSLSTSPPNPAKKFQNTWMTQRDDFHASCVRKPSPKLEPNHTWRQVLPIPSRSTFQGFFFQASPVYIGMVSRRAQRSGLVANSGSETETSEDILLRSQATTTAATNSKWKVPFNFIFNPREKDEREREDFSGNRMCTIASKLHEIILSRLKVLLPPFPFSLIPKIVWTAFALR